MLLVMLTPIGCGKPGDPFTLSMPSELHVVCEDGKTKTFNDEGTKKAIKRGAKRGQCTSA